MTSCECEGCPESDSSDELSSVELEAEEDAVLLSEDDEPERCLCRLVCAPWPNNARLGQSHLHLHVLNIFCTPIRTALVRPYKFVCRDRLVPRSHACKHVAGAYLNLGFNSEDTCNSVALPAACMFARNVDCFIRKHEPSFVVCSLLCHGFSVGHNVLVCFKLIARGIHLTRFLSLHSTCGASMLQYVVGGVAAERLQSVEFVQDTYIMQG